MRPSPSAEPLGRRLLVPQTSFLGDVVLTTPLLRALRARLRPAHLTVLVRPEAAALLAGHPDVDRVLVDDNGDGIAAWAGSCGWPCGCGASASTSPSRPTARCAPRLCWRRRGFPTAWAFAMGRAQRSITSGCPGTRAATPSSAT